MIDLKKKLMPSAVKVDGVFYDIHTDFRYWLIFSKHWQETEKHRYTDFDFLYVKKRPKDRVKGFTELCTFFNPPHVLPRNFGDDDGTKVLDYEQDADLIFSAFYEQYHIDLVDAPLHWHKFLALLGGLHDTRLNSVMGYRSYKPDDKSDYKKTMMILKRAWALETTYTVEEQAEIDKINRLLNNTQ